MREVYTLHKTWKKNERRERIINRILWIIIIILFVIAIIEIVFQFFIAPRMLIKNIIVQSDLTLTNEQIIDLAGIGKKEYYFSLNTGEVEKRLEENSQVWEAVVEKVFPDTVRLIIKKRNPLAVALIEGEDKSIPALIDKEGTIYAVGEFLPQWNLPVLSGLEFSGYSSGMKLPDILLPLLEQLAELRKTSPDLYDFVSEIKVESVVGSDYELIFYMIPYTTRIRFGSSINEHVLTYALMVLDVFQYQGMGHRVKEIDFRTKEIVYQGQGGVVN
jgi:cell division septal protein FtsQ